MKIFRRLLAFLGWVGIISFACVFLSLLAVIVVAMQSKEERVELGNIKTDHAVAVLPLTGEIFSSDRFREQLKTAVESPKIKAVVVRIDSPGGAVGASEEIYNAIKRANEKKPVVCALGNIAASGGIYAAVGCKKIVTNRGTLTGSIGVIMMMPNFSQVLDRYGVGMTIIKSGRYKDSGSPFRSNTPEDMKLLQSVVDGAYEQFLQTVADGRGLALEVVRKFADGRVILGEEAVKLGLVDEVGDTLRAAQLALGLVGDTAEPELIVPKKPSGLSRIFGDIDELSWVPWLHGMSETRLLYRAFL